VGHDPFADPQVKPEIGLAERHRQADGEGEHSTEQQRAAPDRGWGRRAGRNVHGERQRGGAAGAGAET
jgi:hypothetical protein